MEWNLSLRYKYYLILFTEVISVCSDNYKQLINVMCVERGERRLHNFKALREVGPCSYHCILNCYNVTFLCCSGPGIVQRKLLPSIRQCVVREIRQYSISLLFLLLHLMDVTTKRAIDKSLQKWERFVPPFISLLHSELNTSKAYISSRTDQQHIIFSQFQHRSAKFVHLGHAQW